MSTYCPSVPFRFNACLLSKSVKTAAGACRAGTCVGDLANYDLFPIGGPNSVRGFNVGELGSGRSFLEGAAELRLPLPKLSQHIYGFVGEQACFCKADAGAACLTGRLRACFSGQNGKLPGLVSMLACLHQGQLLLCHGYTGALAASSHCLRILQCEGPVHQPYYFFNESLL